eukprot:scaffold83706_cov75-Phaeocystis_antarctica.AAC.1
MAMSACACRSLASASSACAACSIQPRDEMKRRTKRLIKTGRAERGSAFKLEAQSFRLSTASSRSLMLTYAALAAGTICCMLCTLRGAASSAMWLVGWARRGLLRSA